MTHWWGGHSNLEIGPEIFISMIDYPSLPECSICTQYFPERGPWYSLMWNTDRASMNLETQNQEESIMI